MVRSVLSKTTSLLVFFVLVGSGCDAWIDSNRYAGDGSKSDSAYALADAAPRSACSSWCETRIDPEEQDGWCPLEFGGRGCIEVCESLTTDGNADAVQTCVETAPLCFQFIEDCIESESEQQLCADWCTVRAANTGLCAPFYLEFDGLDCQALCRRGLSTDSVNEVELCITKDPMCFSDMADCLSADNP